jgi:DNA-binding response OmpR family regulator
MVSGRVERANWRTKVHLMAKILIIDDEPEIITLIRMMLQKAGYEVIGADSGREGLEILEKDRADLVLLDVVMPDMNGPLEQALRQTGASRCY